MNLIKKMGKKVALKIPPYARVVQNRDDLAKRLVAGRDDRAWLKNSVEHLKTTGEIRYEASREFLHGNGFELGAGNLPQKLPEGAQCKYFDKRTARELKDLFSQSHAGAGGLTYQVHSLDEIQHHFPKGADFMIAHNVLEHCANPVHVLIQWHSYLKAGGIVVLSLPHFQFCPDEGRLLPDLQHLALDYLLDRDENSFESREHIYSFVTGWNDDGGFANKNKFEVGFLANQSAHSASNDLHWHAFDLPLARQLVGLSSIFGKTKIHLLKEISPIDENGIHRTRGDILFVYRVEPQQEFQSSDSKLVNLDLLRQIQNMGGKLDLALQKINLLPKA